MFTNFIRIFRFALTDFSRNKGVSIAAIFVLVVTIMLCTGLLFFQGFSQYLISQIQDKIDVTAYFKEGAEEQDILSARDQILKMPDVKSVEYVSQDQALQNFNEKHKGNEVLSQALEEVGVNPFLPSLNIVTGSTAKYDEVSKALQANPYKDLIDSVDFSQKKDIIDKVFSVASGVNLFGILLSLIFIIIAILVVFNTLKLAVDSSKEEISTMKIVGASNWFVRGPFIVQGAIYGAIAFLFCFVISVLAFYFITPQLEIMLPGFSAISYFFSNLWLFIFLQLGFGAGLGMISSFIVVRKYLKV